MTEWLVNQLWFWLAPVWVPGLVWIAIARPWRTRERDLLGNKIGCPPGILPPPPPPGAA